MTKPTMSAEEALMRSQVNVNTASAIHTQTMAMRELENGGYYELAKGARDVLAVMLGMPEQAPEQQPSEQATKGTNPDDDRRERINAALDALLAEGIVVFPPLA